MIIEIQSGADNSKELCILEFQGEILGDLPGNELGRITFESGGSAFMDIGAYFFDGEVVSLKKPFLVTEKTLSDNGGGVRLPSLKINGIIRKKIIFKTRPKPKSMELIASEKAAGRW